jgi:hypothetical protein
VTQVDVRRLAPGDEDVTSAGGADENPDGEDVVVEFRHDR